jgi:hypothetical protein
MIPKKGRIVLYCLAEHDVHAIQHRRSMSGGLLTGNPVKEGDTFPMLITEDWGAKVEGAAVNGQVFLDGEDSLWVTSRMVGEGPNTWSWPARG